MQTLYITKTDIDVCSWKIPEPAEMEIRAELRGGIIAFGIHVPLSADAPADEVSS